MKNYSRIRTAGFTIIELLIVMGVVGVVMTAVFVLYLNTRSTAHTQEEVVELQQSLRIAADQIARDIRLAGFMLPDDMSPIETADEFEITLRTATVNGNFARIVSKNAENLTVASEEMAALFDNKDNVRIIRTPNKTQPVDKIFKVENVDIENRVITFDEIGTLDFNLSDISDVIVKTESSTFPETISYFLDGMKLQRDDGKKPVATISDGIIELSFQYILRDGNQTESTTTTEQIRAVRFTITGISAENGTGAED
jgi:prepilin-type N-terminal cleavage/methylation domain-containing protein